MKTLYRSIAFGLLAGSLAACNLSANRPTEVQPTLNQNELATQVQQMLASVPAETIVPSQAVIQPQATATLDEATLAPSTTPTPVFQTSPTATSETVDASPTGASTASPTETAAAQSTPTPKATTVQTTPTRSATIPAPTANATANASDPRGSLGQPTRADTFNENQQDWFPFSDSHTKVQVANGTLDMTAFSPNGWSGWTLTTQKVTDFYMEVTAKPGTCAGFDSYGPMLRASDSSNGYLFAVSCDGQYRFQKVSGNNPTDLIGWKANSAILKGADQTNRLGVMAKGNQFTLYVNGTQVDQSTDSSYGSGAYGLFIASYNTPNFTVHYDEVDYWNVP